MPELRGGTERVELGGGYALVAPGLRGRAERLDGGATETRAREAATPLLDDALARAEMRGVATIDITATAVPTSDAASDLRGPGGDDALLLEVPDLGPGAGQVVLAVDEAGALTWHFPLADGEIQPPAVRGAGDRKRFLIRRDIPSASPVGPVGEAGEAATGDRSLFGAIGRKLLKVIVYPITDVIIGKPARAIAEHWETKHRAYGLRDFSPANYRQATTTTADRERLALTPDAVGRLAGGRALLFVHGTFSTAQGGFHDIPVELMSALHGRYGGRVLALDHFTLSHDPARNVRWLLDTLQQRAPDARLEVDIVCHSRGGLVARTLDRAAALGLDGDRVRVKRIAFVGVPNQGTQLAQPDHMVEMIDRLTTGLNILPPGGVADVLEGILIAVKIIGHGALKALDGLRAMDPAGEVLATLNQGGPSGATYYAVAANYEPTDPGLKGLVSRAKDVVVDRIFEGAANDLVVPELGVYESNGGGGFPIAADHCLQLPDSAGVMHTGMFGHPEVARRLDQWLQ
ncbi:MAG: esterase/lipase family protein [Gemmatimonadaceae bacterium]